MRPKALAVSEWGFACTMGVPLSPDTTTSGSMGMAPRYGTPISSAIARPPSAPKIRTSSPHLGQVKPLMFSTTPSTGSSTCRQKTMHRRTSCTATSCGVVTTTAPSAFSMSWATASGSSPVPGGESTTR